MEYRFRSVTPSLSLSLGSRTRLWCHFVSLWLAAGAGVAVPAHDGVPGQRVLEQGQPRGLRPVLRLRLPEGVLEQVQRCRVQVKDH